MLEIILDGGWLMAPILFCSTISVAIVIERFWSLRRQKVVPEGVGEMVETWAARHELDLRHLNQLRSGSALGRVLAAAISNRHRPRDLIKEAVEDTGRHVVHELERFLNTLGTIAGIAPLLGLLGTVIGMIKVFSAIMLHGVGNANELAGGISEALITFSGNGCRIRYIYGRTGNQPDRGYRARQYQSGPQRAGCLMKLKSQTGEEPEINMTSLIDVVFLLLIFFMVSTTFERQAALKIDLPEASVASENVTEEIEKLELVIDRHGNMFLNDRQLIDSRPATIEAAFREATGEARNQPVLLRADSLTPHHFVVTAMDVTGQLGFTRLSIATEQVSEPGTP
jgi:biopolymer transport protein ExbB